MKPESRHLDFGIFVGLLLAAITVIVYLPARNHGFLLFDDADYVTDNPMVQSGLTSAGIAWAFTHFHSANWHPITWLSHMLDVQLFGHHASGPHLVNVLLHAANAVLLFGVLRKMTGALWRSAGVAALFALHPLRVESVAWVAERKDVLSAFFGLLTIWAYTNSVEARRLENRNSRAWYVGALALFALALMSKPMLVTLPFALLLLDFWPLQRVTANWLRLVREKLPFFALSALSGVITVAAQQQIHAVGSLTRYPVGERVANALVSYARYLGKTFWPMDLAVFYPHPGHWPIGAVAGSTLLVVGLGAASVALARKAPFFTVGGLWFFGMLVPAIGLVQVSDQAMADRYTYLPSIGVFIIVVWGAAEIAAHWRLPRTVVAGAALVAFVACSIATEASLRCWRDNETLFRHALAVTGNNFVAHYNLANALVEKDQIDEAVAQFQRTLEIRPDYADARCNLGGALLRQGKVAGAIARFQEVLASHPDHAPARCNLGIIFLQQGNVSEASAAFEQAVERTPGNATAHFLLGNVRLQQGRWNEAIVHYENVLALNSSHVDAHNNLAAALLRNARVDAALRHLETALQIQPDHPNANANLADILLQRGLPDYAIRRYEKVLAIQPANADAHFNLANGLLAVGRVDAAAEQFEKTLALRPEFAPAHNNLGFLLIQQRRAQEAISHLKVAARLQPDNAQTLAGLAWVLATSPDDSVRRSAEAVTLAQRANELSGNRDPEILRSLAAAYAENGKFPDAVQAAERGLKLASDLTDPAISETLRSQLKLYQGGSPFRDAAALEKR